MLAPAVSRIANIGKEGITVHELDPGSPSVSVFAHESVCAWGMLWLAPNPLPVVWVRAGVWDKAKDVRER